MIESTASTTAALTTLVASLADNKYFLGRRYAEWCTSAPSLESAVAAAAMAQDEIGHARSLYPVLEDLGGESPENEPETRTTFSQSAFLSKPFDGWTDFVAANFLFDTAMSVGLEAAVDSSYIALAQRARRILEEEQLHWLHAEGWVRRLSSLGVRVRADLQERLQRIMPFSCSWFDLAVSDLVLSSILTQGTDELRARFLERIRPIVAVAGLGPL